MQQSHTALAYAHHEPNPIDLYHHRTFLGAETDFVNDANESTASLRHRLDAPYGPTNKENRADDQQQGEQDLQKTAATGERRVGRDFRRCRETATRRGFRNPTAEIREAAGR